MMFVMHSFLAAIFVLYFSSAPIVKFDYGRSISDGFSPRQYKDILI
jgi:hypothetical protein